MRNTPHAHSNTSKKPETFLHPLFSIARKAVHALIGKHSDAEIQKANDALAFAGQFMETFPENYGNRVAIYMYILQAFKAMHQAKEYGALPKEMHDSKNALNDIAIAFFTHFTQKEVQLLQEAVQQGESRRADVHSAYDFIKRIPDNSEVIRKCTALFYEMESKVSLLYAERDVKRLESASPEEIHVADLEGVYSKISSAKNAVVTIKVIAQYAPQLDEHYAHPEKVLRIALRKREKLAMPLLQKMGDLPFEIHDPQALYDIAHKVHECIQTADYPEDMAKLWLRVDALMPLAQLNEDRRTLAQLKELFYGEGNSVQDGVVRTASGDIPYNLTPSVEHAGISIRPKEGDFTTEYSQLSAELDALLPIALVSDATRAVERAQQCLDGEKVYDKHPISWEPGSYNTVYYHSLKDGLQQLINMARAALKKAEEAVEKEDVSIDPKILDALTESLNVLQTKTPSWKPETQAEQAAE